jgi:hypothetical protein
VFQIRRQLARTRGLLRLLSGRKNRKLKVWRCCLLLSLNGSLLLDGRSLLLDGRSLLLNGRSLLLTGRSLRRSNLLILSRLLLNWKCGYRLLAEIFG